MPTKAAGKRQLARQQRHAMVVPWFLTMVAVESTSERLPGEGVAAGTLRIKNLLAEGLGQYVLAPLGHLRGTHRRRMFRRAGLRAPLDSFLLGGLGLLWVPSFFLSSAPCHPLLSL